MLHKCDKEFALPNLTEGLIHIYNIPLYTKRVLILFCQYIPLSIYEEADFFKGVLVRKYTLSTCTGKLKTNKTRIC